jgi:MFS family permease
MKPPKFKLPSFGTVLLYLAAAFQATQFARAFHSVDPNSEWSDIGGLIAGIVVNVSLAYSASRLPRLKSKRQREFAYAAFVALLILTPMLLAPINYKTMGGLWSEMWGVKLMIAMISASLVDIAISLVAFADGSLLSVPAISSDAPATVSESLSDAESRSASLKRRSTRKSATVEAKLYRCECGWQTENRYEYSGHTRTCETHKAAKSKSKNERLIPVEMPLKEKAQA